MRSLIKRIRKDESGQSLVELAVVLPITLLIIMLGLTIGFMIYAKMLVVLSASQGARFGASVFRNEIEYAGYSYEEKVQLIEDDCKTYLTNGIAGDDIVVSVFEDGTDITITVTYNYKFIFLFADEVLGNRSVVPISHSFTNLINYNN